jgi:DNA-binding HxlR family transcriptional regulator
MTTTEIDPQYLDGFPEELSKAIDGLSGEAERAVVIVLFNEEEAAFSELQDELGNGEKLHQETLSNALSNLKSGGLIRQRILEDEDATPFSSYYSLSEYGERFVYSLFDSLGSLNGPSGRRQPTVSFPPFQDTLMDSGEAFAQNLQLQLEKT